MQDVLPEGGVIRKLWVGETDRYREHVLRLDAASRHNRFGGGVSDEFIRNYVDLSLSLDTVVHGFFIGEEMRGAAELRQLGVRFPRQAEAAISVEKPWQSHGVGSALLRRTLLTARNRGFRLLHMACLAENRRMQQLARKFDARTILRLRRRRWRGRILARKPVVADERDHGRRPRLRDGDARPAVADAASVAEQNSERPRVAQRRRS